MIADLSSWLAEVAGKAGIAWERLVDAPDEQSLRELHYELNLTVRTIAGRERRVAEIAALRAKDGGNAEAVDRLIGQSAAALREARLSQLPARAVEPAEKVRAAKRRVVDGLNAARAALTGTGRERFVAQAMSRRSAEATAQRRRAVEGLARVWFGEQQALPAAVAPLVSSWPSPGGRPWRSRRRLATGRPNRRRGEPAE